MTIRATRREMTTAVDVLRLRIGFDGFGDPASAIYGDGLKFGQLNPGDIVLAAAISIREPFDADCVLEISDAKILGSVVLTWHDTAIDESGDLSYPIRPDGAFPSFVVHSLPVVARIIADDDDRGVPDPLPTVGTAEVVVVVVRGHVVET
jgi:hypothetical protein